MSEECKREPKTSEKIKVISCETVDAVFEILDVCRRELQNCAYRCVKDSSYDLRPSLWRNKGDINPDSSVESGKHNKAY
jgi:hypothetical protein